MNDDDVAQAILRGPDAIIAADHEGNITFWNAGAERIFGFSSSEAIGRSLDLIIPERLQGRHWHGWSNVMAGNPGRYGAGDLLSVPSVRRDGTSISVEFTIHPLRDPDGLLVGIAATLRDVTTTFNELRALRKQIAERGQS